MKRKRNSCFPRLAICSKNRLMKGKFDAGYYNLALVKQALGDTDAAIENMQKAATYNNQNINYFYGLAGLLQDRNVGDDAKMPRPSIRKFWKSARMNRMSI